MLNLIKSIIFFLIISLLYLMFLFNTKYLHFDTLYNITSFSYEYAEYYYEFIRKIITCITFLFYIEEDDFLFFYWILASYNYFGITFCCCWGEVVKDLFILMLRMNWYWFELIGSLCRGRQKMTTFNLGIVPLSPFLFSSTIPKSGWIVLAIGPKVRIFVHFGFSLYYSNYKKQSFP